MKKLCQSCAMPLDGINNGTEANGFKSDTYCELCYKNGSFVQPDLTIDEMKDIVRTSLKDRGWPKLFIFITLKQLPRLERWRA